MGALENLQAKFNCQMLLVESGGDNLAANYSRELADYIIYVIDVSVSILWRGLGMRIITYLCGDREEIRFREKEVLESPSQIYWLLTR